MVGREDMSALQARVAGRKVVVVGNSDALLRQRLGARIDAFDVVVRMNLGRVRDPLHQGQRCTVLFTSTDKLDARQIETAFAPEWVVWATPKREQMPDLTALGDRLLLHPVSIWDELSRACAPARPSTGLITLSFLYRHCRCADLAFAGFDFFASGTFYHRRLLGLLKPRRLSSTAHDGAREQAVVARMIAAGGLRNLAEER